MVSRPSCNQAERTHRIREIVSSLPLEETTEVLELAITIYEAVDRRPLLDDRPEEVVAGGAVYMAIHRLEGTIGFVPKDEVAAAAECTVAGLDSAWRAIGHSWNDLGRMTS